MSVNGVQAPRCSQRGTLPGSGNRFQLSNQPASIADRARGIAFHRISAFPYAILM
jgi:hypothetical protein